NGCSPGNYDIDAEPGCECQLQHPANAAGTCVGVASAISVGSDPVIRNGNIPDGQVDWFQFSFPSANTRANRARRKIEISISGPANTYKFEVKDSTCGQGRVLNTCTAGPAPELLESWSWSDPCNGSSGGTDRTQNNTCRNLTPVDNAN